MSAMKNYNQVGVANLVQYGKQGGLLGYDNVTDSNNPVFKFRVKDNSAFIRLQVADPTQPDDAATKRYLDALVQGLRPKESAKAATDATSIGLTGSTPLVIDGYTVQNSDRILVKDQINRKQNGVYDFTDNEDGTYALARSFDANTGQDLRGGTFVFVTSGSKWQDTGWVISTPDGVANLGVDNIVWTQFSSAGVLTPTNGLSRFGIQINLNTDQTTTYIDTNNNAAVKSSSTPYQVLVSQGSGTAQWTSMNLASSSAVGTSVLTSINGGTGFNTYSTGDILKGNSSNTLSILGKGSANQVLRVKADASDINYQWNNDLRDTNGALVLSCTGVSSASNYATLANSSGADDIVLGTYGTSDTNLVIAPQGRGLLMHKAVGYAFDGSSPANAFVPKFYVDNRVNAISTSRIQNASGSAYFDAALPGYTDMSVAGGLNKPVAAFLGSSSAVSGEILKVTHLAGEVQLQAVDNSGTASVNLRLMPQSNGQVYIGTTGAGVIKGENAFNITLSGSDSTSTADAGDLFVSGGLGLSGNRSGGNVWLKAGLASGSGNNGVVEIQDPSANPILHFASAGSTAVNYFQMTNSLMDTDATVSAVKMSALGSSGDIGITLSTKGAGLLRVTNQATYLTSLKAASNPDCLPTKKYVDDKIASVDRPAGVGLTLSPSGVSGIYNVNTGASTIKTEGSNNLIVNSSATANQVLISYGSLGVEAVWGALTLSDSNAVTGTLPLANGGLGFNSITQYDLVVGGASNTVTKLSKGSNNQWVGINGSGVLAYNYMDSLRDTNGAYVAKGNGVTSANNYLTFTNANTTAPIIGSAQTGSSGANVDILMSPSGSGLVRGRSGYTVDLKANGTTEHLTSKQYVDDAVINNVDPLARRAIVGVGASSVNVGTPLPNITSRSTYVNRITINVTTPFSGNSATQARVLAGTDVVMQFGENDISVTGIYVADFDYSFTSNSKQCVIEFYQANGTTYAVPTSGAAIVHIGYTIE